MRPTRRSARSRSLAGLSVLAILVLIAYSTTKEAWPIFKDDAGELPLHHAVGRPTRASSAASPSSTARSSRRSSPWSSRCRSARHRPVHHRGRAAAAAAARRLRPRPARRRAVGGLRPVGHPRAAPSRSAPSTTTSADALVADPGARPALRRAGQRPELLHRRAHPGHHDHADHHLAHPRGLRHRRRPREKEAAYGLGATRWEMIRGVGLPPQLGGMVGAVMLGLGRAMGETIAVALVIGSNPQITANLFAPGDTMPSVIANEFGESSRPLALRPHRPRRRAVRHHHHRQPGGREPSSTARSGGHAAHDRHPDRPAGAAAGADLEPDQRSGRRVRNAAGHGADGRWPSSSSSSRSASCCSR